MAKVTTSDKEVARQENIHATVSKTDQFYKDNKKTIWGIVIAVVVVVTAVFAYNRFVYQPKCAEAQEQAFPAEASFATGEYQLALEGDGNVLGFAQIIEDYGSKAGKSVYYDAAVCALRLEKYEDALTYISKYSTDEPIMAARALGIEGDALVALGQNAKAAALFVKAADVDDNVFAAEYLVKAGLAYEAEGQNDKALECYKEVKDQIPASIEAYDIDKYITRIENK